MKIKSIKFENKQNGLKINKIEFFKDVTLLVGLSGAGKTQILNAIEYSISLAISNDTILKPCEATIEFIINEDTYLWSYKIEPEKSNDIILENQKDYVISYEELYKNNTKVFSRKLTDIFFEGYDKLPQPKKNESLLFQYSEDDSLNNLTNELKKLYSVEMELEVRGSIKTESFNEIKAKVKETIDDKPNVNFWMFSHLPVLLKIYIAKKYFYNEVYIKIFEAVKELFIEIEDIDIVEDSNRGVNLLAITVYNNQILQSDISNGMLKTLYYIVELFTMSQNSLVLIDEFENGLGVNCIDVLAELLLSERNDLQFIITSHHPKIINTINYDKWLIIDREINIVKNSKSVSYGIGNSQHDAYFNLINRWEYEGKI